MFRYLLNLLSGWESNSISIHQIITEFTSATTWNWLSREEL